MENFTFQSATKIIFGNDITGKVGEHAAQYGKKYLLHYGGSYAKKSGLLQQVEDSLKAAGVEYITFGGVVPNPRLSLVHQGVDICKTEGVDAVLALGGGSVIDSAKAIAMGACYNGDVWDFYDGKAAPQEALPVGVFLTIPGAGSEMSNSTVISKDDGMLKRAMASPLVVPQFSLINPEVCYSIPPHLMAAGIADMLAHMFERYFTPTPMAELSDRLIEGAMQALVTVAPKLMQDPKNYDLCAEIMWIATIAHNGILDAGRVSDWASHRIEHEMSALYDVTHGLGLAVIFPAWMQYTRDVDVDRYVQLATRVFGIESEWGDLATLDQKTAIADKGIVAVRDFFKSLGLPTTFAEADIPTDRFAEMAEKAVWGGSLGGFTKIHAKDVLAILELAKE